MKVKGLVVLISILFLCGCTATYDLKISDETITETITVTGENDNEVSSIKTYPMIDTAYISDAVETEEHEKVPGVEYYDYKLQNNSIIASYEFKDRYADSHAANYCYPSFVFLEGDENSRINTTINFECLNYYPDLNKVTINIDVPYTVVRHNATKVDGTVYTWVVERGESDAAIDIEYKAPKKEKTSNNLETYQKLKKQHQDEHQKEVEKKQKKINDGSKDSFYLVLLSCLFFGLLFVIIIFRSKMSR